MRTQDPIAALEIGTTNTTLAIGEAEGAGRVRITALGTIPSMGVRKSHVIDIAQAAHSVDAVLKSVERDYRYAIGDACLGVSGADICVKRQVAQWQLLGPTVSDDDLREIYNRSLDTGLDPAERTLLEESETGYGLDDMADIASPKGMAGHVLTRHSLCLHGSARRIADMRQAARQAHLELNDVFFSGLAAANAVLTPADRDEGTLHIDLGGGSTAFTLFDRGHLVHAGVVGVGGDHVTNDVRTAFSITQAQAEEIKRHVAAVVGGSAEGSARLTVASGTPGFDPVTVSRRSVETVVNARLQELFTVVLDELDRAGFAHRFQGGVVLTGGVSATPRIADLCERVLGRRTRIGSFVPEIVPDFKREVAPASCATVAGLLLTALRNQEPQSGGNVFKRFFGGMFG